jgi:hypothetical protein
LTPSGHSDHEFLILCKTYFPWLQSVPIKNRKPKILTKHKWHEWKWHEWKKVIYGRMKAADTFFPPLNVIRWTPKIFVMRVFSCFPTWM